jgi:peptide deformylase
VKNVKVVVPPEYKPLWQKTEDQPVVKYPAEILRSISQPIEKVNKKIKQVIEKMESVIEKANGIGLAAPQIGVAIRIIVIAPEGKTPIVLINPNIVFEEGKIVGEEGCLSLPGLYGEVERAAVVEVEALDSDGRAVKYRFEGLPARIAQHEIDHLNGVLFIDKADPATLYWAWPTGKSTAE